jgi:thioester reductase-like protein
MNTTAFITGATGLVGGNLVVRLLRNPEVARILLLVRAESQAEARARLFDHLKVIAGPLSDIRAADRIEVLPGDVTLPRLGLATADYERLAGMTTHMVHAAANVRFDASLDELRPINCGGTRHVLDLALRAKEHGRLERFGYVGTAYVSGNRTGTIYEHELKTPPSFANAYEQSKFEAESLVRSQSNDLPITILRPSIIAGDTKNGVTTSFTGLYYPLRLVYQGLIKYLPGSRTVGVDVVPIDFVTEAIHEILFQREQQQGRTFHLTCRSGAAPRAGEILDEAVTYFRTADAASAARHVSFVPVPVYNAVKHLFGRQLRSRVEKMSVYIPYMSLDRSFDTTAANRALAGTGIVAPAFSDYCQNLFRYCVNSNWGRRSEPSL